MASELIHKCAVMFQHILVLSYEHELFYMLTL